MTSLPDRAEHVRTTDVFDDRTVPPGLLRAHRVAAGTWGRLVVHGGSVRLVFEDGSEVHDLEEGDSAVIPPQRPHHVELGPGGRFAVEFHRPPSEGHG